MNQSTTIYVIFGLLLALVTFIGIPFIYKGMRMMIKKTSFQSLGKSSKIRVIHQLNEAVTFLSREHIGAIITIQMKDNIEAYRTDGLIINANISASLIISLFNKKSPLHDGAIIIENDKITYVATYYKITDRSVDNRFGARHRAALGISDITDSVTIVTSEETGKISIVRNGKIKRVPLKSFQNELHKYLRDE